MPAKRWAGSQAGDLGDVTGPFRVLRTSLPIYAMCYEATETRIAAGEDGRPDVEVVAYVVPAFKAKLPSLVS
jgi:hypothetical protein